MKKRIAFDVKGTLFGPKQRQVVQMFKEFKLQGCEMFIWSSMPSYCLDAQKELGLDAELITKRTINETEPEDLMDIAVEDDHSQTYLATKQLVFVDEIPDDEASIAEFVRDLITHR